MNKNISLENVLCAEIIKVLDDARVSYELSEQDGSCIAELEFTSDHGGDQVFNVWFDKENADETFASGLSDVYEDFDVDEYVEMWLNAKRNGTSCPLNARELVEDAESIDAFLDKLSTDVYAAMCDAA